MCYKAEIWHGDGGIIGPQDEMGPEAPGVL